MASRKTNPAAAQSVKVFCRVRPTNKSEINAGGIICVKYTDVSIETKSDETGENKFNFDHIFGMDSTQSNVFSIIAEPLITDVLRGYNATILAYGQSGTGKTHTMEGDVDHEDLKGIIPRAVDSLFASVNEADENIEFIFKVSFIEIYLEKIRDLLDPNRLKTNLTIREDKIKGIYVAGVTEEYVTSADETLTMMSLGANNRATAATGLNVGSSRSHSVFTITVVQKDVITSASKSGKLVLVDLAGSEMVRKSNATGQQLEEAKMINKSLSALGLVINALTDSKSQHIPYRDSKLTRILTDSLGGNSKTALIIAVSPSSFNAAETVSTLRFGTRAKSIENIVTVNQTRSVEELEGLLLRAEKAIDAQSAYIVTLSTQLQAALNDNTTNNSLNNSPTKETIQATTTVAESEESLATRLYAEDKIIISKSQRDSELHALQQLQECLTKLQEELDEEKQETSRKDVEIKQMTILLKEKEKITIEAINKCTEIQRSADAMKERSEITLREKMNALSEIDSLKTLSSDTISKLQFQLSEMETHTNTLETENKQLKIEIATMSGEDVDQQSTSTTTNHQQQQMQKEKAKRANVSMGEEVQDDDEKTGIKSILHKARSSTGSTNTSVVATTTTEDDGNEGNHTSTRTYRRDLLEECFKQVSDVCVKLKLEEKVSAELYRLLESYADEVEKGFVALDEKYATSERIKSKRFKDLEEQRYRLEKDLQTKIENVIQLQYKYDSVSRMQRNGKEMEDSLAERDTLHLKSLQQRLEQLVAVHRQLLRKFSHLELESLEAKKKLQLRDERIHQLEGNSKGLISNIRQQAERHVAELSILREQIQIMKSEHEYRIETMKAMNDLNQQTPSRSGIGGNKSHHRTLRGGGGVGGTSFRLSPSSPDPIDRGLPPESLEDYSNDILNDDIPMIKNSMNTNNKTNNNNNNNNNSTLNATSNVSDMHLSNPTTSSSIFKRFLKGSGV